MLGLFKLSSPRKVNGTLARADVTDQTHETHWLEACATGMVPDLNVHNRTARKRNAWGLTLDDCSISYRKLTIPKQQGRCKPCDQPTWGKKSTKCSAGFSLKFFSWKSVDQSNDINKRLELDSG